MLKRLSFILICVSVLIIQSHDVFVHHHDFLHAEENDHNEAGHNLFSYVDIAEEFTLQNKIDVHNTFVADIFFNEIQLIVPKPTLTSLFIPKNEYPPPKPDISFQSLRGPPIS
jgi:hypothetical protein